MRDISLLFLYNNIYMKNVELTKLSLILSHKQKCLTFNSSDGSAAGPGAPEASLTSPEGESVSVALAAAGPGLWRATYTPRRPGDHQLRVIWAGRLVKGKLATKLCTLNNL